MKTIWFDREEPLTLFRKRIQGFLAGYRQNLSLLGEAGMGKTALLRRLQREFPATEQMVLIYAEVKEHEPFREWARRFVQSFLYGSLQTRMEGSIPASWTEILESSRRYFPRTASAAQKIIELSEGSRWETMAGLIWDLPALFYEETGCRVVLLIDEFHRLSRMPFKQPFRLLGQRVMVQNSTLFLLSSSELYEARSILREGLALLFGQFEVVELKPLSAESCRKALRELTPDTQFHPLTERLLIELAQGHPSRLYFLMEALRRLPGLTVSQNPDACMIDLLEAVFLDPQAVLSAQYEERLSGIPESPERPLCFELLQAVSEGKQRVSQLVQTVHKPTQIVLRALATLEQSGLLAHQGVFYFIPERLFALWMRTAYPVSHGLGLAGSEQAQLYFRDRVWRWLLQMREVADQPLGAWAARLLREWNCERLEIENRVHRLPRFESVEPVPFVSATVLHARSGGVQKDWIVIAWPGALDETAARRLIQRIRSHAEWKAAHKLVLGPHPVDLNARLMLQEAKIKLWDLSVFDSLCDWYGLPRWTAPIAVEFSSGSVRSFPEISLNRPVADDLFGADQGRTG